MMPYKNGLTKMVSSCSGTSTQLRHRLTKQVTLVLSSLMLSPQKELIDQVSMVCILCHGCHIVTTC